MTVVNDIGLKYLRFFVDNSDERWVIVQGGRRSGKSFAIYKWLYFLASSKSVTVGIVAATFPAIQLAINDFKRATGLTVNGSTSLGFSSVLSNGSVFVFRSFDVPEKAQGSSFDILYLEECLNISEQVVSVLSMSVTGQIYAAFNPTKTSYLDKYRNKDGSNWLTTTFKDNPHLTKSQVQEFENIKKKALASTATVIDRYNYQVYYLGNFCEMTGKVFKEINKLNYEDYKKIQADELYGLDFGFTENEQSDATALVGCKIFNNCLYFHEYIYSNSLTNNKELALRMCECGIDEYSTIVADYGGMGATRIRELVTAGNYTWNEDGIRNGFAVQNAVKEKIIDGLQRMNQFDKIYVTNESFNLIREMEAYELNREGKPKTGCSDHAIDAARYCANSYAKNYYY